ncbi:hypothetical protein [Kitasatospora sp. NPDC085879]
MICSRTNNPPDSTDGKAVIDIGVAPVRPAEYIAFTMTQTGIA